MPQLIGVPRETAAGEKRVATVPEVVEKLIKLGFRVAVESGAGDAANFADDTYDHFRTQIAAWTGCIGEFRNFLKDPNGYLASAP